MPKIVLMYKVDFDVDQNLNVFIYLFITNRYWML